MKRALVWIRRDLRLTDHVALAAATQEAQRVAVAFVLDPHILEKLDDRDDRRVGFIHRSLQELDARLRSMGSRLIVLHEEPEAAIPNLVQKLGVEAVFFNGDVDPYALERDAQVKMRLKALGVTSRVSKDHVIFARKEVLNQSGEPFKVFTPYSKAWLARLTPADTQIHAADFSKLWPSSELDALGNGSLPELSPLDTYGFLETDLPITSGESAAIARLSSFEDNLVEYGETRDFVHLEAGTSGLSPHLRHGTISIRECVRRALANDSPGARKWLSELIWREFYHMILSEFPHVVGHAFKPEMDSIQWPGPNEYFEAWKAGLTGYPIVDAAMRCLRQTGLMHNRLRMIAAMFLTKDLLVDWRLGEAHFARYLMDFDLASNNGGWQWSASTGVDAQPYFRIFNPVLQSRKFDPDGAFIRRLLPELAEFTGDIHWPHEPATPPGYPAPIVDHHEQKAKALALFESAKLSAR